MGLEPTSASLQARCSSESSSVPREQNLRTGGVEPPQREATGLQPAELASLSVRRKLGRPTGFEPVPRGSRPRMLPLHHSHHETREDARGRPDSNRRLLARQASALPLSYAPKGWRGWDSNPRSRAHEAREDSHSSTALRSGRQESNLRSPVPKTGGVARLPYDQTNKHPRRELNPRFRLERPASSRSTTGASRAPAAGIEPAAHGLTVARLPARLHRNERRQQDSNLRTVGRLRVSTALPSASRPFRQRKGRESNPRARGARLFSSRGAAPLAALPEARWPRQDSNLHHTA